MEYKEKTQNKIYKFGFLGENGMTVKVLLRAVALLIAALLIGGLVCLPVGAREMNNSVRLLYRTSEAEDGILEIEISLESGAGICAMLCVLDYNPDSLIYLSGGSPDESVSFTVIDFGGEIRFLLDSRQNTAPDCVLARLYFKKTDAGKKNLSLRCQDARYLSESGEILSADTLVLADGISEENGNIGNKNECAPPQIISQEITSDGGICFSVKAARDCFAAGARLFFVDLEGAGENFEVLVAGVTSADGIVSGEYHLCPDKRYAISVTAIGYDRLGGHRGERMTVILDPQA